MKIHETRIDNLITYYEEHEDDYMGELTHILESYPELVGFLMQESNDILTEVEKDLLWYVVLIIIKSCEQEGMAVDEMLKKEALSMKEEENWAILEASKRGTFYERISPFFENYAEEDLLAFVEDTVQVEEGSPITKIGRDVIFISAKSIIDLIQ